MKTIRTFEKLTPKQREELKSGVIQVSGKAMNRTALGVVKAVFTMFPAITFQELKEMLPDEINPTAPVQYRSLFKPYSNRLYGVIQAGTIRGDCQALGIDVTASHFTKPEEIFFTADGTEVLVSRSWESKDVDSGQADLQKLIDHVAQYGIKVVKVQPGTPFQGGDYQIEVLQPALLQDIQRFYSPEENTLGGASGQSAGVNGESAAHVGFSKWIVLSFVLLACILLNGIAFYWVNGDRDLEVQKEMMTTLKAKFSELKTIVDRFPAATGIEAVQRSQEWAVFFKGNTSFLTNSAQQKLDSVVIFLLRDNAAKVALFPPFIESNMSLTDKEQFTKQVDTILGYLSKKGINQQRWQIKSSYPGNEDYGDISRYQEKEMRCVILKTLLE